MEKTILCLNSGSSSLKFALFSISESAESRLANGAVEDMGPNGRLWLRNANRRPLLDKQANLRGPHKCIAEIFAALDHSGMPQPTAAGHRIVHGGPLYTAPQKITRELQAQLRQLISLAPLHLPAQIELIQAIAQRYPELPQVACFDTAFHARMPEVAQRLPVPRSLWDKGVRRYGFHGLSYEFILNALGVDGGGRVIIAHLGNGASMAAIRDRQPVDTSMGLTPAGGFMMSTRTGDLDPGVLLYLLRAGHTPDQLEKLLNRESGLVGVSTTSSDMKTLLESRDKDPLAGQAVQMFCYEIRKFLGAYAAVLGGLDTLVFTGGIGEQAAVIREEVCLGLEFLGIQISPELNAQNAAIISKPDSRCTVRVMVTDEDLMIARHTWKQLAG
ncbi:MAG TPA: acetate/propionate family kinase [Candidatus Angelobacter sp.]|nr:acetate/propionate family kinase [Candidatus Angelobacter sp.]